MLPLMYMDVKHVAILVVPKVQKRILIIVSKGMIERLNYEYSWIALLLVRRPACTGLTRKLLVVSKLWSGALQLKGNWKNHTKVDQKSNVVCFLRLSMSEYFFFLLSLSIIQHLREQIRWKRPDLWKDNSCILHHDNAASHKANIANKFKTSTSTSTIEQPSYSSDMTA